MNPYLSASLFLVVLLWIAYTAFVTIALLGFHEQDKKQKATIKELGEELGRWRRDYNIMKDDRDRAVTDQITETGRANRGSVAMAQIDAALREYYNHGVQG